MPRLGPPQAQIIVLTFKEGLLSRVAHDLQIRATDFQIDHDQASGRVTAQVDVAALRVDHAMKKGRPSRGTLSNDDRATIDRTIRDVVLHSARYPQVRFDGAVEPSSLSRGTLRGEMTLHGVTRPVVFRLERSGGTLLAECRLDQRSWGVEPYRAMMGALKVQPEVVVRVSIPWTAP